MPVVTEEEAAESVRRRSRGARALYLLLVPPVLLLGLAAAALVRPVELQLGPLVVVALSAPAFGGPQLGAGGSPIPAGSPVNVEGRFYVVTGSGWAGSVTLGGRGFALGWFRGHRK